MAILAHIAVAFGGFLLSCVVTTIIIVKVRLKRKAKEESEETS